MKSDNVYALAAVLVLVIAVSVFAAIVNNSISTGEAYGPKKPFHLGVTYCGSSVDEAKQLVDKVKSYTNLFVVQSNYLQSNLGKLVNVCDYAVDTGLDIIVYSSSYQVQQSNLAELLTYAQSHWDSHFLGVYYNDEPGGKMLDAHVELGNITKDSGVVSRVDFENDTYKVETFFFEIRSNNSKNP